MSWYCRVLRFDGDYAIMVKQGDNENNSYQVARALLPEETCEGMLLLCENFIYSVAE